jgi:hypothetical protein
LRALLLPAPRKVLGHQRAQRLCLACLYHFRCMTDVIVRGRGGEEVEFVVLGLLLQLTLGPALQCGSWSGPH